MPDRALQKVVRLFYRDSRCLTDIVRCVVLVNSIPDMKIILEEFVRKSVIVSSTQDRTVGMKTTEDEESLLSGSENLRYFRLCKIKDRFTCEDKIGYRDICLNVEVGWTIESESENMLHFVTVDQFGKKGLRQHICEVRR